MLDIVLASGSPRRSALLKQIGLEFRVVTENVKETYADNLTPEQVVSELSARKGEAVFEKVLPEGDTAVIAADTIVALDKAILGKPKSEEDAFNMLRSLSGKMHRVYTGVTIFYYVNNKFRVDSFVDYAEVYFRELSDEEIRDYIATGEPMDKAGAYGIQEKGAILVDKIVGDFYTIVGLPVVRVYNSIKVNTHLLRG
jgi:septum formation protein